MSEDRRITNDQGVEVIVKMGHLDAPIIKQGIGQHKLILFSFFSLLDNN
jgi:hypothetical protein